MNLDGKSKINKIVSQGIVAAIYVVLTLSLPAFGPLQFRISEIITLLAYYNPIYVSGLTLGCFIANIFSPFGIIDMILGAFASFLALYSMSKIKNIWIASVMPSIFSIIIGFVILLTSQTEVAFFVITGQIMLSEFILVSLIGVPIFKYILMKNKFIKEKILEGSKKRYKK